MVGLGPRHHQFVDGGRFYEAGDKLPLGRLVLETPEVSINPRSLQAP
jgi:hypothetical protein